jgi:hypothetical protein
MVFHIRSMRLMAYAWATQELIFLKREATSRFKTLKDEVVGPTGSIAEPAGALVYRSPVR